MSRRSTPQKVIDGQAFPLVAYFRVPETGLSGLQIDPHTWLLKNIGLGQYAWHAASRPTGDAFGVYFRRLSDLLGFIEAHPALELADDTDTPTYTSPYGRPRP